MKTVQPPTIIQGEQLDFISKPIIGKRRGNKLIAMFNLLTRAKVVSPDGTVIGQFSHGSSGEMILSLRSNLPNFTEREIRLCDVDGIPQYMKVFGTAPYTK